MKKRIAAFCKKAFCILTGLCMLAGLIILPAPSRVSAVENNVYIFDMENYFNTNSKCIYPANTPERAASYFKKYAFDFGRMAAAVQGIINRDGPIVFYKYIDSTYHNVQIQDFYLDQLSQPGEILNGKTQVTVTDFYEQILRPYISKFSGIVLWDENVPATADVALTIAGVENLLPVRYDTSAGSLYTEIMSKNLGLSVVKDLTGRFTGSGTIWGTNVPSTGSAKCDAYIWARINYIDTGLVHSSRLWYVVDGWTQYKDQNGDYAYDALMPSGRETTNADYFVKNKVFCLDLMPTTDYTPNDDPNQPLDTDYNTFSSILGALRTQAGQEIITVTGFPEWWYKYSSDGAPILRLEPDGNSSIVNYSDQPNGIGGGDLEVDMVELLTKHYAHLDSEAQPTELTNASLYSQVTLNKLEQNTKGDESKTYNPNKRYVCVYMGDFDGSAWINEQLTGLWNDPRRGEMPVAYGICPATVDRIPNFFNYSRKQSCYNFRG